MKLKDQGKRVSIAPLILTVGVVYSVQKSLDACGVISLLNKDTTRLKFFNQGRVKTPLNSVLLRLVTFFSI